MPGRLVLVVGPSGAGKDTLLAEAKTRLQGDSRFLFPQRLITREPDTSAEDHLRISRDEFETIRRTGDYTLLWEAHGLGYVIPASVKKHVANGKIAVCNASRAVVANAVRELLDCSVILITADETKRAHRLASRGRETLADITSRLQREGAPLPPFVDATVIDNSGHLADSVDAFCTALRSAGRTAKHAETGLNA